MNKIKSTFFTAACIALLVPCPASAAVTHAAFLKSNLCKRYGCPSGYGDFQPRVDSSTIGYGYQLINKQDELIEPKELWITEDKKSGATQSISYVFWNYYGFLGDDDIKNLKEIHKIFTGKEPSNKDLISLRGKLSEFYRQGRSFSFIYNTADYSNVKYIAKATYYNDSKYESRKIKGTDGDPEKNIHPIFISIQRSGKK